MNCSSAARLQAALDFDAPKDYETRAREVAARLQVRFTALSSLSTVLIPDAAHAIEDLIDALLWTSSVFPSLDCVHTAAVALKAPVLAALSETDARFAKLQQRELSFENVISGRLESLKMEVMADTVSLQEALQDRELQLSRQRAANEGMTKDVSELKEKIFHVEKSLETANLQARELLHDAGVKKDIIDESEKKLRLVVAENKILRGICGHQQELLDDIDNLKRTIVQKNIMISKLTEDLSTKMLNATSTIPETIHALVQESSMERQLRRQDP